MARPSLPTDLGTNQPAQPTLASYPKTQFGDRKRSFLSKWFDSYKWLEYSEKADKSYCFACRKFGKEHQRNAAFRKDGYDNWPSALDTRKGFKKHDGSDDHKDAMKAWDDFQERQKQNKGVGDLLNKKVINDNQYYLNAILDCIQFLISNGIPFRGDKETIGSLHDPSDDLSPGIFLNMIEYTIRRDEKLKQIAAKIPQNAKYTSPKIQNEVISILSSIVQKKISDEVRSSDANCFCIKCDGTRDKNNVENICIVLQYVVEGRTIQRLLDIVAVEDLDANSLTESIVGTLEKCDLPLDMIVSQCYDGASVMSGVRAGVQQLLREKVGRDIFYIHCFNHQLHLAVVNAISSEDKIGHFFDICGTLYVFLRRQAVAKMYDGDRLKRLLDTRWSGHLDSVNVLRQNYEELVTLLLEVANSTTLDGDIVAIGSGLLQKVITAEFQFLIDFLHDILSTLEPINRQLQSNDRDLASAVTLINVTKEQIGAFRNAGEFEKIQVHSDCLAAPVPAGEATTATKRKRRLPARFKDSIVMTPIPHFTSVDEQKRLYVSVLDCVEAELDYRFSETRNPVAEAVTAFDSYSEDIDREAAKDEAKIAKRLFERDPSTTFYKHRFALQTLYTLWAISKTIGASTAFCESAFSTLTRVLTPYRRSMTHDRLSSLVALSFEKKLCDDTSFDEFLVEFRKSPRRLLYL